MPVIYQKQKKKETKERVIEYLCKQNTNEEREEEEKKNEKEKLVWST